MKNLSFFKNFRKQKTNWIFFNSAFVKSNSKIISVSNRSFQYGDGIFETMVAENGKIKFLEDHIERLSNGLSILKIEKPTILTHQFLNDLLVKILKKNNYKEIEKNLYRLKLQIWRKPGGLYSPENNEAEFCISIAEFKQKQIEKNNVLFYDEINLSFSTISPLKTCNSLPYIMASLSRKKYNVDDMILSTKDGYISECTSTNIFWIKDDTIFTPSLYTGCIDGIMRKQVINKCSELNINIEIGEYSKDFILDADAAFTSNVTGFHPIKKIEEKNFSIDIAQKFIQNLKL